MQSPTKEIRTVGDPVLRKTASEVPASEITSPQFKKTIERMRTALSQEKFGVAIAAPQIGESVRAFAITAKIWYKTNQDNISAERNDKFFFNPKIIKTSKKKRDCNEGCLSVPLKYGTRVPRHEKVTCEFFDENGKKETYNASGFIAQIIQHEVDHLNGILYTDIANEVIDVDEELRPVNGDADIASLRSKRI